MEVDLKKVAVCGSHIRALQRVTGCNFDDDTDLVANKKSQVSASQGGAAQRCIYATDRHKPTPA